MNIKYIETLVRNGKYSRADLTNRWQEAIKIAESNGKTKQSEIQKIFDQMLDENPNLFRRPLPEDGAGGDGGGMGGDGVGTDSSAIMNSVSDIAYAQTPLSMSKKKKKYESIDIMSFYKQLFLQECDEKNELDEDGTDFSLALKNGLSDYVQRSSSEIKKELKKHVNKMGE